MVQYQCQEGLANTVRDYMEVNVMYEKLLEIMNTRRQRSGIRYEKPMAEVLFRLWQATPTGDRICLSDVSEYFDKNGEIPYALRVEEQTVVDRIESWFNRRNRMICDGSGSGYRKMFIECMGMLACAAGRADKPLIDTREMFELYSVFCEFDWEEG